MLRKNILENLPLLNNIMNKNATEMGYGWASKNGTEWGIYHTMATGR